MTQTSKRLGGQPGKCRGGLDELMSPRLFKALSDPRRISLLIRLAKSGEPCTVSGVAEGSGVDVSVVSRHLAVLREAGVIQCEKQGKEVWCVVRTDLLARTLRELADALETCCPRGCRVAAGEVMNPAGRRRTKPAS